MATKGVEPQDLWMKDERVNGKRTGKKVKSASYGKRKRWRVEFPGMSAAHFVKKDDAWKYIRRVQSDRERGITPFDHDAGKILFSDYAWKCLKEHYVKQSSRKEAESHLRCHLIPTFGTLQMREIYTTTVKSWLAALRDKRHNGKPYSEAHIYGIRVTLNVIMRSALVDGKIQHNPTQALPRLKQPTSQGVLRIWGRETVDAVLAELPDREHAKAHLAMTCGHRHGEASAVAEEDINWFRKEITIRHQVQSVDGRLTLTPPKGDKTRTVPLSDVTAQSLAAHIQRYGTTKIQCSCCEFDNSVLFVNRKGELVRETRWNERYWHPALKAVGITRTRKTGLHMLRHFYASTLIDRGADALKVQRAMGHANISITYGIYGHLLDHADDKIRSIIDAAFGERGTVADGTAARGTGTSGTPSSGTTAINGTTPSSGTGGTPSSGTTDTSGTGGTR